MSHIVRAHEPTQKGINISKGGRVITIFSTSHVPMDVNSEDQDHGCQDAFCGCILVDTAVRMGERANGQNIIAINHPDATRVDMQDSDSDSDRSLSFDALNEMECE